MQRVPLKAAVTTDGIMAHLREFDAIASHHGNRAFGTSGYNASVDFVLKTLRDDPRVTCEPEIFPFRAPHFQHTHPPIVRLSSPLKLQFETEDARVMMTRSSVEIKGREVVEIVDPCDESQWEDFPIGAIASSEVFMSREDGCTFFDPIALAEKAGAAAYMGYNKKLLTLKEMDDAVKTVMLEAARRDDGLSLQSTSASAPHMPSLPLILVKPFINTLIRAENAATVGRARIDVIVSGQFFYRESANVLCDTKEGDENSTIVIGSHLDGVPAGPGIDDNASGSATNLELALQLYRTGLNRHLKNRIRFAWWGAEEAGLLGSYAYLANLTTSRPAELAKIAMNLNMDMLGAPNGFAVLCEGRTATEEVKEGSIWLEETLGRVFNETFPDNAYAVMPMMGGSDFYPFVTNDPPIPAAGLQTGASNLVTPEQRSLYGALANAAADPCYHQSCDGIENIDEGLLKIMSKMAAGALELWGVEADLRGKLGFPYKAFA
ncbi:hypothetical protein HK101_007257 [Irineochytrium annulatum]|nr:hypothetical protein HK101_007257 [Irineochytrium annulatum]